MIPRVDRWLFVGLVIAVLGYVLLRALLVPLVHDEATSFLAYAQTGHLLPFASMWDANQHYLNSFLGFLGYRTCGLSLFALRWGSVFAFILYVWSAWRLGTLLLDRRVRWALWLALILCPFLLDFFSLFRGYGLAMAFWLLAIDGLIRYWRSGRRRDLLSVLLGLLFANAAMLALVPTWGIVLLLLLTQWWKSRTQQPRRERNIQFGLWLLFGLFPFVGASGLSILMARTGLLYQGSTEGFVPVTVMSLLHYLLGTTALWAAVLAIGLSVAASLVAVVEVMRSQEVRQPLVIITALLWMEIAGRLILGHLFGINFPEDRTALHLVPLLITQFAFTMDALARRRSSWAIAATPLLLLPGRSLATMNIDHTLLWPEQSTPLRFSQKVHDLEQRLGRPAVVGAYRLSGLNWSLQQRMLGGEGDIYAQEFPSGLHDVRIVDGRFLHEAMDGYVQIDHATGSGLHLLVREPPFRTTVVLDTSYALEMSTTDRTEALELGVASLREHDLLLEITGRIASPARVLDLRLGIAVLDTNEAQSHGDIVFLSTRGERWNGEAWRSIRYVPRQPAARSLRVFFWEPDSGACSITDGRLLVRTVEP